MGRRALLVAVVASAAAAAAGGHVARGATASTARSFAERHTLVKGAVVVRQTGVSTSHLGHEATRASWGVVLANTSPGRDALNVRVTVDLVGANGKAIPHQGRVAKQTLALIPAGRVFYYGGTATINGDIDVRGVRARVTAVGATPSRRFRLPPVFDVHLDTSTGQLTGTFTNPYSMSISPYDCAADIVLFDRYGRIIGGDGPGEIGQLTSNIAPGAASPVSFSVPDGIALSRIASARITVFPG